jgi:peroxiredoxin
LLSVNDQIEVLGATVVALTPQSTKKNRAMIDKNDLSFDLLHDIGNDYAS